MIFEKHELNNLAEDGKIAHFSCLTVLLCMWIEIVNTNGMQIVESF